MAQRLARLALTLAESASWPRYARTGPTLSKVRGSRERGLAAIRVPERVSEQLSLLLPGTAPNLFVHEGARQALVRKLEAAHLGSVVLSVTDNRQSIVTRTLKRGVLHVRVHHMFLDAPPKVVNALVRYIVTADRSASDLVGRYIDDSASRLARRKARHVSVHTRGKHHDLMSIFNDVNARYFGGSVNALITWGPKKRRGRARPRRSIKLGSYASLERLIRIHPSLDRSWVPRYFVAFVIYHELLHAVMPASRSDGRRTLHSAEFYERERLFRAASRAEEWERKNLTRLLRSN